MTKTYFKKELKKANMCSDGYLAMWDSGAKKFWEATFDRNVQIGYRTEYAMIFIKLGWLYESNDGCYRRI